jgi:PAS domain S-box-containing protein
MAITGLIKELIFSRQGLKNLEESIIKDKEIEKISFQNGPEFLSIFDDINMAVYVIDPESLEILYANKTIKQIFGRNLPGKKCHEMFQGDGDSGDLCTYPPIFGGKIDPSPTREFQNRLNQRWYRCIGKAIKWPNGKMVRLEMAIDIHDHKMAFEALRENEERYRTILETIEDGYYEVDLKGSLLFFNDALCRLHEYPREELIGMNNRRYTDTENAKKLYKAFNQVYRTGEPSKTTDYEIITKNEKRKRFESSISLVRDSSGNPIGFRGIIRDITESKRIEAALRENEERFRIAAQSSSDFIYEWDLESGQIDWFGDAVEKLSHLLGEIPFTATAFQKIIYPDDYDRFLEPIRRHLRHGGSYREKYRIVGKDGRIIHVKAAGRGLRNQEGKVYKWIGALSDITDSKRAEEELKGSLEKLHKAMGGIINAMALTVENRDPYTAGHQQRVSNLARAIAQGMGLPGDQIEAIRMAGSVHDLGKISVPAEILSKPGRLSDIEFSLVKAHPQTSYDILKDIEFPWPIAEIVLQHHERINGSGYPFGLKGREIILEARILMVADVVEAIASHRPYRPAKGIDAALEEIAQNRAILYDPAVVDACLRQFKEDGYRLD